MTLASAFQDLVASAGPGPLMIHADVFQARHLIEKSRHPRVVVQRHLDVLSAAAAGRGRWFAAFNYDFLPSGRYEAASAPCQVGALGEAQRLEDGAWRSRNPVFSFVGPQDSPAPDPIDLQNIEEFDAHSPFAQLVQRHGSVCFYGAQLSSCTFLHHVEKASGGPLYRYDKRFRGQLIFDDGTVDCRYLYHVRPMGPSLDYDWPRLEDDVLAAGVMRRLEQGSSVVARLLDAAALRSFWLDRLADDPLYLLDDASRSWVEPKLDALGRRFELEDFEEPPADG